MNENSCQTIPAAEALHKVPGFDPTKYLCRTVNQKGEPVVRLELRCQRRWFRLACPEGRLLLDPLRITDRMAIFEAKVFLHREDPVPVSSFTATRTAQEAPDYIRAAQDEALMEALDNAGFGIQMCDLTQESDQEQHKKAASSGTGDDIESAVEKRAQAEKQKDICPPNADVSPSGQKLQKAADTVRKERPAILDEPLQDVEDTAPGGPAAAAGAPEQRAETEPVQEKDSASHGKPAPEGQDELPLQTADRYTEDMSIEEILQCMTQEEAETVVVPRGPCTGWTMAQVAQRRPSSLRFFLTSFCECSNVQKAAATLLLHSLEQQKAG